jgi:hypothetical protein
MFAESVSAGSLVKQPDIRFRFGDTHHLSNTENQKDFRIRMRQGFDHYLRDEPAPLWMQSGGSFPEKEREMEMVKPRGDGGGEERERRR